MISYPPAKPVPAKSPVIRFAAGLPTEVISSLVSVVTVGKELPKNPFLLPAKVRFVTICGLVKLQGASLRAAGIFSRFLTMGFHPCLESQAVSRQSPFPGHPFGSLLHLTVNQQVRIMESVRRLVLMNCDSVSPTDGAAHLLLSPFCH